VPCFIASTARDGRSKQSKCARSLTWTAGEMELWCNCRENGGWFEGADQAAFIEHCAVNIFHLALGAQSEDR
jgi:hypothetical protein